MSAPPVPVGGDRDRGGAIIGIYWSLAAFASVVVGIRFYSRRLIHSIGTDDWLMLVGLIFQIVLTVIVTYEATIGGFRHLYYLTGPETEKAIEWNYIMQCFGISSFTAPRLSVGMLIIRIQKPIRGWKFWLICTIMVLLFIINSLDSILTYVQCNPPDRLWENTKSGKCWNSNAQANFSIFQASFNVFTDTVFALLPSTIIWGLQMPIRARIALCLLLGPGLFAAVAGIVKISFLKKLNAHSDITWETYNLAVWSGAENFVVLVCGSVPACKSLYDRYLRAKIYSTGHTPLVDYADGSKSRGTTGTGTKISKTTLESQDSVHATEFS